MLEQPAFNSFQTRLRKAEPRFGSGSSKDLRLRWKYSFNCFTAAVSTLGSPDLPRPRFSKLTRNSAAPSHSIQILPSGLSSVATYCGPNSSSDRTDGPDFMSTSTPPK